VRRVLWTAAATVTSAVVLGMWFGREVWLGMLAPLMVATATWILAERVHRESPERLTAVLISAFAGKLVFFGAYVGLAIAVLRVELVPFAASFAGYFISLHMIEALWLQRLLVSSVAKRRGA